MQPNFVPSSGAVGAPSEPVARPESMADRLRAAYVRERQRMSVIRTGQESYYGEREIANLDGGKGARGRTFKSPWAAVLSAMQSCGCLDPEGFIAAQFDTLVPPTPQQLGGPAAIAKYRNYLAVRAQNSQCVSGVAASIFASRVAVASTARPGWTPQQLWTYVLLDPALDVPPLFKYITAVDGGLHDVAEQLFPAALDSYTRDPAGQAAIWGSLLPAPLLAAARQIMAEIAQES